MAWIPTSACAMPLLKILRRMVAKATTLARRHSNIRSTFLRLACDKGAPARNDRFELCHMCSRRVDKRRTSRPDWPDGNPNSGLDQRNGIAAHPVTELRKWAVEAVEQPGCASLVA